MARQRLSNIALQEKALAEAQRQLERIEKMRETMAKQVELEMQRLNEMRERPQDFTQSPGTTPSLSTAMPGQFASQFDKFRTTASNERLEPVGPTEIDFTGKLAPPQNDMPVFRTSDKDEHYTSLTTDPGKMIYISGYYYSSGSDTKRYEYILGSARLPIAVGDMIEVPVHGSGHGDGRFLKGHDRRFVVTDIYTKPKFTHYHDVAW